VHGQANQTAQRRNSTSSSAAAAQVDDNAAAASLQHTVRRCKHRPCTLACLHALHLCKLLLVVLLRRCCC
jgi:hypothetical protein